MRETALTCHSFKELEVGRTYRCILEPDGTMALSPLTTPGRPRSLSGPAAGAARALSASGYSIRHIARCLNTNAGAVRTAIGAPR